MVEPSWIREQVVRRILENFESSLSVYRDMMHVARDINLAAGEAESRRLGKIMHAAIRCASDRELQRIRDLFAVMKCEPVNYYDLRERVSVESTAFRPVTETEILKNGFRIFCSKLSLECIPAEHRDWVQSIIDRRELFDVEFDQLIDQALEQGGLESDDAERFIEKSVAVFTRPDTALVSLEEHERLKSINKVAAQILISNSLAFNHLTPSVASVPAAHEEMQRRGIRTIPVWQGPVGPDVILRQTSCLAPPVVLKFPTGDGQFEEAEYQETFVEFEERLQALTPEGRMEFERLFDSGKQKLELSESDPGYAEHYYQTMREALSEFPKELDRLRKSGWAYFRYQATGTAGECSTLEEAIEAGVVQLVPQQYEDFFGPAATNIFNSNIGLEGVSHVGIAKPDSQAAFERSLGREVVNMYDYYTQLESESRREVCEQLGLDCGDSVTAP